MSRVEPDRTPWPLPHWTTSRRIRRRIGRDGASGASCVGAWCHQVTAPRLRSYVVMRLGRLQERLVADIEATLTAGESRVESPSVFSGRLSGSPREVDVAVFTTVGSSELITIFEVRDHRRPQGPGWIEQVGAKRRDVGAHGAVAVSTSGFTKGAVALAAQEAVEIRTLRSAEVDDILRRAYWPENAPKVLVLVKEELKVSPIRGGVSLVPTTGDLYLADAKAPLGADGLRRLVPDNAWQESRWQNDTTLACRFRLGNPRPDGTTVQLRTKHGIEPLDELFIDYTAVCRNEWIPLSDAHEYSAPDGTSFAYALATHLETGLRGVVVMQTGGLARNQTWVGLIAGSESPATTRTAAQLPTTVDFGLAPWAMSALERAGPGPRPA